MDQIYQVHPSLPTARTITSRPSSKRTLTRWALCTHLALSLSFRTSRGCSSEATASGPQVEKPLWSSFCTAAVMFAMFYLILQSCICTPFGSTIYIIPFFSYIVKLAVKYSIKLFSIDLFFV